MQPFKNKTMNMLFLISFNFRERHIVFWGLQVFICFSLFFQSCKKRSSDENLSPLFNPVVKEISVGVLHKDSVTNSDSVFYKVKITPNKTYAIVLVESTDPKMKIFLYIDKKFQSPLAFYGGSIS